MSLEKCKLFNNDVNSTTTDIKIISSDNSKYLIDYKGNKVTDTGIIDDLNYITLDTINFKNAVENLDIANKPLVSCIVNLYKIIAKDIKESLPACKDSDKFKFIVDNLFNFILDFDLNSFNKDDIERYFIESFAILKASLKKCSSLDLKHKETIIGSFSFLINRFPEDKALYNNLLDILNKFNGFACGMNEYNYLYLLYNPSKHLLYTSSFHSLNKGSKKLCKDTLIPVGIVEITYLLQLLKNGDKYGIIILKEYLKKLKECMTKYEKDFGFIMKDNILMLTNLYDYCFNNINYYNLKCSNDMMLNLLY